MRKSYLKPMLLLVALLFVAGCGRLARMNEPKYPTFPESKVAATSPLNAYLPQVKEIFEGNGNKVYQTSLVHGDLHHQRHKVSGRILRRTINVWIGFERLRRPGECSVGQFLFAEGDLGGNRWAKLSLRGPVYGRTRHIGGRIDCPVLKQQPQGQQVVQHDDDV